MTEPAAINRAEGQKELSAGFGNVAASMPARVAAASGGSIMTETALKYSPQGTVEDAYPTQLPGVLPREQVMTLARKELAEWLAKQPRSRAMTRRGRATSPWGVLGNHQKDWNNMPQNIYCEKAVGNKFWDIDGNEYLDFSLGDTPDMYGHGGANPAIKAAAAQLLENGICTMAPNEDGVVCTELMAKKFGLSHWMANLSASDANRAVPAIARQVTGRNIIAIPNFTYHGNLDETQKMMPERGVVTRFHEMNVYPDPDVGDRTRIFTYNDLASVEEVLKDSQVACLMMEPIMSNFGWAWPQDNFNEKVYELCQKYGTKLAYDETHTLSAGPAGACGELGLHGKYDFWVCGKGIGFGGLFEFSHAYAWNRGILIMPYFNMLIVTPQHSREDTDRWLPVWDDIVRICMGG